MEDNSEKDLNNENLLRHVKDKDRALTWAVIGLILGFIFIPEETALKTTNTILLAIFLALFAYNWKAIHKSLKKKWKKRLLLDLQLGKYMLYG